MLRLSFNARPMATPQVPRTVIIDAVFIPIVASAATKTTIFNIISVSDMIKCDMASSRLERSKARFNKRLMILQTNNPTMMIIMPNKIFIPALVKKVFTSFKNFSICISVTSSYGVCLT